MRLTPSGLRKCADMKNFIAIVIMVLAGFLPGKAQDAELNKLVDIVKSLRSGGEKARSEAVSHLASDEAWTPMDEAFDRKSECRVSEVKGRFKLNPVLTDAEYKGRRYQYSTGNHLNGADNRYNYSLYEKTIKAKTTSTFHLRGRLGEQTFIILPYDGASSGVTAEVTGNASFKSVRNSDGSIKITGVAAKDEALTIKITNGSGSNESYVILNHNSRK